MHSKPNQKHKLKIEYDDYGLIKYPIIVTGSLKILDLGVVEFERPSFHSAANIFPIGFKSLREHSSCIHVGGRASYTCEILDGFKKPIFKVTSSEFPDQPIIRDSASGCWLEIVKRIEEL